MHVLRVLVVVGVVAALEKADDGTFGFKEDFVGQKPPMGWNQWNAFHCFINEDLALETAAVMVDNGLADAGYNYVNLDDCWQVDRDPDTQVIIINETAFPSGMPALADSLHAMGLKFGVYSDAGTNTCQGRPGSLGFEVVDAQTYADWGADYLKYDNCFNEDIPSQTRYPVMRDALDQTGRADEIFFNICNQGQEDPATWAPAISNSWRTTNDINDSFERMLFCLDGTTPWTKFVAPGSFNDPDMLEIGNGGMSTTEYIAHFSLWAMLKAPLLIGTDVRTISQADLDIYTNDEVIAINQDDLGVSGSMLRQTTDGVTIQTQVWGGPLADGSAVVVLLNRTLKPAQMLVTWAQLGFTNSMRMHVRDLWAHEDLGLQSAFSASVEPHGVIMIKVTPE